MDLGERVLVLAPHTDDGELGCGATISRLLGEGKRVSYAALSTAADSLPPGMPADQLAREVRKATASLGIAPGDLHVYDYAVRKLNYHRQEVLEDFVRLREAYQPDMVFTPSRKDVHQDHAVVTAEALRAFKHVTIFGYELPWNNLSFDADCFLEVSESDLSAKVEALRHYRTQARRDYMNPDFTRSLARVRGTQVGVRYAEAFEVIRIVL